MPMLEVCVDEAAGIEAAVAGGADRIELCAALSVGGLTPPVSLVRLATEAPIPVNLLARPRDGDFCYSAAEVALIAEDITLAAEAGLAGVVIGASAPDRRLDALLLAGLVAHAREAGAKRGRPLSLTLHRAFDLCPDLPAALDVAVELGFDRILTSGGEPRAADALPMLAELHQRAAGRIIILPGSGIDANCLPAVLETGVREAHASCRSPSEDAGEVERRFGFQTGPRLRTDTAKVAAVKAIMLGVR
ncbi:copper homeostasis protein CutC [Sphingomonas sp. 3-13AW]|jgi:copper homeostasis protein|uniref:copper homeostasis protein CutC n=1 Tax=Sphingomonas sp. 3-13AW TaxID=3050450 RepID=UPI003BB7AEBE